MDAPHGWEAHLMIVRDLGSRAVRSTATRLGDWAALRRGRATAAAHLRDGRPGDAVLEYGRLVREVQGARESLGPYDQIAQWLEDGAPAPEGLSLAHEGPERFLCFVGYSRSGHSLVGSLLDAHPDVSISHELHAVKHLRGGASFERVKRAILLNSFFFDHFGRAYSGYDYQVEGEHQGRVRKLRVLGDKKANGTTRLLRRDAALTAKLRERIPAPVDYLHVVRNPFDNIVTKARRTQTSVRYAAAIYMAHVRAVEDLKRREGDAVIDLFLDDLIAAPESELQRLLVRLELRDAPASYLPACAGLLWARPKKTRSEMRWPPELLRELRSQMRDCEFLARFADEAVAE